jgi:hypothetical protein
MAPLVVFGGSTHVSEEGLEPYVLLLLRGDLAIASWAEDSQRRRTDS